MVIIEAPKFSFHLERPGTYQAKKKYIIDVKHIYDITPEEERPIRTAFLNKLFVLRPIYIAMLSDLEALGKPKGNATDKIEELQPSLIAAAKDFISSFNAAIKRDDFVKADRSYYGLPLDSDNMPEIKSREQITFWCNNLTRGEAKRVSEGGTAMSHPTIDRVTTLSDQYFEYVDEQLIATEAYIKKEDELIQFQFQLDQIIIKCVDDTITFYNHLEASVMRKHCRRWGIRYSSRRVGKPFTYTMVLEAGETKNIEGLEVAPNTEIEFQNTTPYEIYACLSSDVETVCSLENLVIGGDVTIKVRASDISESGESMVNLTNPSTTRQVICLVTI